MPNVRPLSIEIQILNIVQKMFIRLYTNLNLDNLTNVELQQVTQHQITGTKI